MVRSVHRICTYIHDIPNVMVEKILLDMATLMYGAAAAAAAAESLQSCPTLCDPIDGSPPGSLSLGFSSKNTGVGGES